MVEAAADKQAADILLLDMRGLCSFADYFVICSGETRRQIEAICDEVRDVLGKQGVKMRRLEGATGSGWVLMDFGDVIMHVFAPDERDYYKLEELWGRAKPLVSIQ